MTYLVEKVIFHEADFKKLSQNTCSEKTEVEMRPPILDSSQDAQLLPLPTMLFAGVPMPVPQEGLEIQKYHYPYDWWKESRPVGC